MLHLPFWKFLLATATCVLVTTPMQVGVGYLIGLGLTSWDTFSTFQWVVSLTLLLAVVIVVVWAWRRFRRQGASLPRAKARWLRQFRSGVR